MSRIVRRASDRLRRLARQTVRVLVVAMLVWVVLRLLVAYVLAG